MKGIAVGQEVKFTQWHEDWKGKVIEVGEDALIVKVKGFAAYRVVTKEMLKGANNAN